MAEGLNDRGIGVMAIDATRQNRDGRLEYCLAGSRFVVATMVGGSHDFPGRTKQPSAQKSGHEQTTESGDWHGLDSMRKGRMTVK